MSEPKRTASSSFTELELAFFETGDAMNPEPPETFADLDAGARRPPSLLRRLFGPRSDR
jgi:hypothetical protein